MNDPALVPATCHGGPLDGRELYLIRTVAEKARQNGHKLPMREEDAYGFYTIPKDDPIRLLYAGQLPE